MQTQPLAPESRPDETLRTIESRSLTPAETARAMLHDGNKQLENARDAISALRGESHPYIRQQCGALERELDAAWGELAEEIAQVTAPEQSGIFQKPSTPAEKEETEQAFVEIQNRINEFMTKPRVAFDELDQLARTVESHPDLRAEALNELTSFLGPKFSERVLTDATFRKTLREIQDQLSGTIGEEGPEICVETTLRKLVLAHELFGTSIRQMIDSANLTTYASDLKAKNTGHAIVHFNDPTFDGTGECDGNMSCFFEYEEIDGEEGLLYRTYSRRGTKQEDGRITYEKYVNLDKISLPTSLKNRNTAKKEMAATERVAGDAGFDWQTLHANIDVGGYAWATMEFGWDVENMQKKGEPKEPEKIIQSFIKKIQSALRKRLSVTHINLDDPSLAPYLNTLQEYYDNPLAVTPQQLAALGKDGPKFIFTESGKYYREEDYEEHRKNDPPNTALLGPMHLGKMLMLGSDWYGQRRIQKSKTA